MNMSEKRIGCAVQLPGLCMVRSQSQTRHAGKDMWTGADNNYQRGDSDGDAALVKVEIGVTPDSR